MVTPASVWVASWQMQCCGEPFAVGGEVRWTFVDPELGWLEQVLGPGLAGSVDRTEDHHAGVPEDAVGTPALVTSIRAVHLAYGPATGGAPRPFHPVPGSVTLTPVTTANGWEPEDYSRRFLGYLVELRDLPG